MKMMAIFVEGGTEMAFAKKLLLEIAGAKNIEIQLQSDRGGGRRGAPHILRLVEKVVPPEEPRYLVRIIDCGNDDRVRSRLSEAHKDLCREGYQYIVGLRDVRGLHDNVPTTPQDLIKIHRWMKHGLPLVPIMPLIVVAVMEVEAWFLAENTHFLRIDGSLDDVRVASILGFDPSAANVEARHQPSNDLNTVYQTVGKSYQKFKESTQQTIESLDYCRIYLEVKNRAPAIGPLISVIEDFLN